jgi:predicted NAD/FAD-binding protein
VFVTVAGGSPEAFDHVIFACHSDQALRMLEDPTDTEREVLTAFPYEPNEAILHTDASLLPRRRGAWSSWNYRLPADRPDRATVTYHMNQLQGLDSKHEFLVTLNDDGAIDPDRIVTRILYHHPAFIAGRAEAQARHVELIDTNRTSYCGAYWGWGFHEDGVRSALRVASVFGRVLS